MMPTATSTRSGFSLIEVIITVIVLAIAVPPTLNLMDSASSGRADAINTTRATFLATTVIESVLADLTSREETLGYAALGDADAYLSTPVTGLYARLEVVTEPYTRVGMSYSVEISDPLSADGAESDEEAENRFRTVTVRVGYPAASTTAYTMPVSIMVSEL